jgi:glutathione synthase/RimK-type ligase-like ATP-grasp enzyme
MNIPTTGSAVPLRVALLTAGPSYAVHDVDREPTGTALQHVGIDVEVIPWDSPRDWTVFDAAVVRSTWDYTTRLAEFLEVLQVIEANTRLLNPRDVIEWNVDKRYLRDLAEEGVPVVPTRYVTPLEDPEPAVVAMGPVVVVKPVVSAGAKHTARHDHASSACEHAQALLAAGHTVMVQPYLERVNTERETGLVFLAGEFSHAFAKAPILAGADGSPSTASDGTLLERITPRQAAVEQRVVAEQVMDRVQHRFGRLLYARVDVLPSDHGPVVLEVELVEPNLFLSMSVGAADRFARCLLEQLWVA